MPPSPQTRRRQRGHVVAMLGWTFAWLAGTAAIAGYSVTRHAPALERLMLDEVQDAIAPLGGAPIMASVADREATLSGTVDDVGQRDALLAAADGALGIRHVIDRLVVREPLPEAATLAEPATAPATAPAAAPVTESIRSRVERLAGELAEKIAPDAASSAAAPTAASDLAPEAASPTDTGPEGSGADDVTASELMLEELPSEDLLEVLPPEDLFESDELAAEVTAPAELMPQELPPTPDPPSLSPPALSLDLVDRVLTIEGSLAKDDDAAAIVLIAMDSFELDYVSNTLESGTNVAPAGWLESVATLLPALNVLDDPGIDVAGHQVTLYGTAPDATTRETVVMAALESLGDYSLIERIDVAAGTISSEAVPDEPRESTPIETALLDSSRGESVAADAPAPDTGSSVAALRAAFSAHAGGRILFESGSATLTVDSLRALDDIAGLLQVHPGIPVAIEGHTDGLGPRESNLRLSQRRANAVREHLVSRGVVRERLTAYGYGEGVPLADNATPEGRAANRRIEFTF